LKKRILLIDNVVKREDLIMSPLFWLNQFLNFILSLLSGSVDKKKFKKYLLALILEDKYFSVRRFSKTTREYSLDQFYYFLKTRINWNKLFIRIAKLVILTFGAAGFYLTSDGSPLKQRYAQYRIAKHGHISIKEMKNVPQNELISLGLTNGIIYIPILWDIWVSSKVSKKSDFKTKPDIFMNLLKRYLNLKIPVKTVMFDSFFTSKEILKWLNKNGFKFTTRIKKNRTIYTNGIKHLLCDLKLKEDESIVCTIQGIKEQVKILMFHHKDEEVYACSNNILLSDAELKAAYKSRWEVEVFHRESKQKLGLENFQVEDWQKLVNHVGFVCLAYSLLTMLRQKIGGSVGDAKFKLQDEVYGISSSADTFEQKLAS
jgi:hypothetical protein